MKTNNFKTKNLPIHLIEMEKISILTFKNESEIINM